MPSVQTSKRWTDRQDDGRQKYSDLGTAQKAGQNSHLKGLCAGGNIRYQKALGSSAKLYRLSMDTNAIQASEQVVAMVGVNLQA